MLAPRFAVGFTRAAGGAIRAQRRAYRGLDDTVGARCGLRFARRQRDWQLRADGMSEEEWPLATWPEGSGARRGRGG
ncbi:hypothetical protein ON010_g16284 [Phytophthora cinnamomi]|nr:hypothetical protein ON010_g16284 [Phytophthora cinnamomi]